MKKTLIASILFLSSCANEPQFLTYETFPTSASLQSTSVGSVAIQIEMIIGSNGCYRYKGMRTQKLNDTLRVRFYGEQDITPGIMCTMAIVEKNEVVTIERPEGVGHLRFRLRRGVDTTISLSD